MIRGLSALVLLLVVAACGGASLPPAQSAQAGARHHRRSRRCRPARTPRLAFQPPVTFTVPEGWALPSDTELYPYLRPVGTTPSASTCSATRRPRRRTPRARPRRSRASAGAPPSWRPGSRERPGLVVSAPTMATVGGLSGIQLDVGLKADWTQSCPFANGIPSVPLFNSPAIDHWVVVGNERLRACSCSTCPAAARSWWTSTRSTATRSRTSSRASAGIVRSLAFATSGAPASALPSLPRRRDHRRGLARPADPGAGPGLRGGPADRAGRGGRAAATCRSSSWTTARPTTPRRSRRPPGRG